MNIGYVFLIGACILWLASSILFGFKEVQLFGYLLLAIAIVLVIRNYYLKRK